MVSDEMRRLVLGAVVLGLVAACGGGGPAALRGDPQAVVRAAAERTMAAGTARVDVTLAVDTAGTGLAGSGVVDLRKGRAALSFQRTGSAAHLDDRFTVVVDGASQYVQATAGRAGGPATAQEGGLAGTTPAAPWLAGSPRLLAVDGHDRISPLDTLLVRPGAATDLAFLRGAVKVLPYGGQEVRGVNTFRYSLLVDLRQAIVNSPVAERPPLEAASDAIGPVLWPVDVWLDSAGRVRHLEMAEDPELHSTTTRGNIIIFKDVGNVLPFTDLDFSDFGTPAKISVPNPDQAVEAR